MQKRVGAEAGIAHREFGVEIPKVNDALGRIVVRAGLEKLFPVFAHLRAQRESIFFVGSKLAAAPRNPTAKARARGVARRGDT